MKEFINCFTCANWKNHIDKNEGICLIRNNEDNITLKTFKCEMWIKNLNKKCGTCGFFKSELNEIDIKNLTLILESNFIINKINGLCKINAVFVSDEDVCLNYNKK